MSGTSLVNNGVAVITGGASGFGLGLGRFCASRGMAVALLDLDGERARSEAAAIAATHDVRVLGLDVDVSDAKSVDAAASAVADRLGGADLVFSNVGIQLFGSTGKFDRRRVALDSRCERHRIGACGQGLCSSSSPGTPGQTRFHHLVVGT